MTQEAVELLLVEDSPHDVELTLRALKKHNLANRVFVVKDGEEALNYLFCRGPHENRSMMQPPRVIFLDLKLPKVSGLDVLRAVKADDRTKSIPIVMLTSSQQERDVVESYQLGVNSYIVKPIDFNKFVDSIAELGLYWIILNHVPR